MIHLINSLCDAFLLFFLIWIPRISKQTFAFIILLHFYKPHTSQSTHTNTLLRSHFKHQDYEFGEVTQEFLGLLHFESLNRCPIARQAIPNLAWHYYRDHHFQRFIYIHFSSFHSIYLYTHPPHLENTHLTVFHFFWIPYHHNCDSYIQLLTIKL